MRGRGQLDMRGKMEKKLRCGCCMAYSKRHQLNKLSKRQKPTLLRQASDCIKATNTVG